MDLKSLLFVPATRKERFQKALQSGASAIIIDLEDSVSPSDKASARENILSFIKESDSKFFVRINDCKSEFYADDVKLLRNLSERLHGVILPKSQSRDELESLNESLDSKIALMPLIESARGVRNMETIATAKGVVALSFGALDLALDLGLKEGEGLSFALKSFLLEMALVSRCCNILPPINGVYPSIDDMQGLRDNMTFAHSLGFSGSLCIHPKQVSLINEVFAYSSDEIAWAKEIVRLAKIHNNAVFSYEGKMIDMPVIKKARGILGEG